MTDAEAPLTTRRPRSSRQAFPGLLLVLLWVVNGLTVAAAPPIDWSETLYNPQPLPDDVLLPLPCGGAMAFRAIPTPAHAQAYPVTGPFVGTDGGPHMLLGKYELTRLQVQALRAEAQRLPCPSPDAAASLPYVGAWAEGLEVADRYSQWLATHAKRLGVCRPGASPCVPQVDGVPAFVRLPLETEWAYAARGGLAVNPVQFAASRYPMPEGLSAHTWYAATAEGVLQPIGQRAANPLGLHDVYGNVAELMLGPYRATEAPSQRGAAVARGGDARSEESALAADLRQEVAMYSREQAQHTGIRLLASVPVYTSAEKVREAERRADTMQGQAPPPPPVRFLGNLRVTVNVPAEVQVDGEPVGRAMPGEPLALEGLDIGEHQIVVTASGYAPVTQGYPIQANRWTRAEIELAPLAQPPQLTEPTALERTHPFEPEMIALPGGTLWMGSPKDEAERDTDEGPRHKVGIAPFAIGKYAVTFDQYDAFAAATGRNKPNDEGWGRGKRPVIGVSWTDAVAYATWLSEETAQRYRLPTEAEWEYAARAGTESPFWTGACLHTDQANYNGNYDYSACGANTGVYREKTVPVGSLPANPWGLHEVHGNVWEWVQDCWHNSYAHAPADGSAWESGDCSARVLRGGSWVSNPRFLRSANRDSNRRGSRRNNLGFRLARTDAARRADTTQGEAPPPPPARFLGNLRVTVNVPAEVQVDGEPVGRATPDAPLALKGLDIGEHQIVVTASGYAPVTQGHRIQANRWTRAEIELAPLAQPPQLTEPTALERTHPFEPEMIALPGGTLWMGSPKDEPERDTDEGPRHKVRIAPFAVGKHAATFDEYDAFAEATGRDKPKDSGWGRGKRPVIGVSWTDAVAYATWLSEETAQRYRLPTEAEWEYAARADTESPFWTGACLHTDQANYNGNYDYSACGANTGVYREKTVPVGSLPANPWGLHEIHGNVWEWVQDCSHNSYVGAPADGSAWESGDCSARVLRGGSWFSSPRSLRSAHRYRFQREVRWNYFGFRLARTLSP